MASEGGRLPSCVPLPIPNEQLKEIVPKAKDWAILHGISMRSKNNFSDDLVQISPFLLLPTCFPRSEFNRVVELHTTLQELLHKVAHDKEFLKSCYKDLVTADDFSARLFKIYEQVEEEGLAQKIGMIHMRSDYLLNNTNNSFKQVEFNTISSSFASLATIITEYNKYILAEMGHFDKLKNIPDNNSFIGLVQGLIDAWKLYNNKDAKILFVVEEKVYNISDQILIEFEIRRLNPKIKVLRRTFSYVQEKGSLNAKRELILDNSVIAVVYLRDGYNPAQYPTELEWEARLMMERSTAIKCPDIKYHLVGQKKVQQELTKTGVLEKFLTETKKIDRVREIFVGIHGLQFDENGERAVQMALEHPEKFVLKPQREGGGHNLYGEEIRELIQEIKNKKDRLSWILMERIFPLVSTAYMIQPGGSNSPSLIDVISELGIYGILISDPEKIIVNRQVGHTIRSKASTSNEGGVIAGFGALDCPYLLD